MWYFVMLALADECLHVALRGNSKGAMRCSEKAATFSFIQRVVMEALFEKQVWENEKETL